MNEQENFWSGSFGKSYRDRNKAFDVNLGIRAWKTMLTKADDRQINTILECGSNVGRNLKILKKIYPTTKLSLIEINKDSYKIAVKEIKPEHSFRGSIIESGFQQNSFDLVFTAGVLIHIPPYDLYRNLEKIFHYSRRYILFSEYFSRDFEVKLYHGQINKLFKMDFGRYFLNNFKVKIVDYGFLWGHEFDAAGFDDATWGLFKK